jgi:hypothetical protein
MREVPAVLVASDPTYTAGEFLPLDTWGGKRWEDVVHASVRSLSEVQMVANVSLTDYDAGVGKPGTEAWGWALCDGQNSRPDLLGKFVAGLDPARTDYDAVGKTGGLERVALSLAELPAHSHGMATAASDNTGSTGAGDSYAKSYGGSGGLDQNRRTTNTGSNTPHENRPPFYVLAFRQWVGFEFRILAAGQADEWGVALSFLSSLMLSPLLLLHP